MIFLVLSFFVMQGLVASHDNLLKTSDVSADPFKKIPVEIINVIVSHCVNFNIKPVTQLLKEMKELLNFRGLSSFWSQVIPFKRQEVLKRFCILPIEYFSFVGNFEEFAKLLIEPGVSLFSNPNTYTYARCSESREIVSLFYLRDPSLINGLGQGAKKDTFSFANPIEFHGDMSTVTKQFFNLKEFSLDDLKYYFYKLVHDKKFYDIQELAKLFLNVKKNKYLSENYLKVLFLDCFFKTFFERSLFCSSYYNMSNEEDAFCLDPNNKFFINAYKIDVNTVFDALGISPLIHAMQQKNVTMVELLINEYGASVNALDYNKRPPVLHAILAPVCFLKILLLSEDIDLYWTDNESGDTLLHYLAKKSLIESAIGELLLSHLKNPDFLLTKNKDGKTYKEVRPFK